jgi:prolyl oligopeptidase
MSVKFRIAFSCILVVFFMSYLRPATGYSQGAGPASDDPYAWLEDVTGEKSLDWVRARNKVSQSLLEADPEFAKLNADLLAILDSDERIPMVSKRGEFYYNFWRDKENPRGLWRRTTLVEYEKPEPKWDVIIDLDALGKEETPL